MKYIRMRDGIYEVVKEDGDWIDCVGSFQRTMKCQCCIKKHAIIKQANTIKELCDELIFDNFYHSRMTPIAMHTKENQEIIKGYLKQNIICYGAIWTDKGLIYVAKMNDKGELELIWLRKS